MMTYWEAQLQICILWRMDPLLSGDSVRLGKHVPAATNTHATTELLFLRGPCRDVISKGV
jgi:hypothetical protein